MVGSGQSVATMVAEFLSTLATVIWLTLVAVVKAFLPVSKKNVRNEIVLVTGAGSGIGKLMASRFAESGATVRHVAPLKQLSRGTQTRLVLRG